MVSGIVTTELMVVVLLLLSAPHIEPRPNRWEACVKNLDLALFFRDAHSHIVIAGILRKTRQATLIDSVLP